MLFNVVCVNWILLWLNFFVFNVNFFLNFLLNLELYLFLRFKKDGLNSFFFLVKKFLDLNVIFMLNGSFRVYCCIKKFIGSLCFFWLCFVMWLVKVSNCMFLLFLSFVMCMFCMMMFLIECMCGVWVVRKEENMIFGGCGKCSVNELSFGELFCSVVSVFFWMIGCSWEFFLWVV